MSIYRSKTGLTKDMPEDTMERKEKQIADISGDIIDKLSGLSTRELAIMRYMNKSVLNFLIKHESLRDMIIENFGNQNLFGVILNDRNNHLVENIVSSEYDNIFVIYGLMHFQ